nr:MAG TPA: hypothetical protein [Caudoviricetes sp.]
MRNFNSITSINPALRLKANTTIRINANYFIIFI